MQLYLAYTSKTESPTFYHRWCGLTCLAAWIGRDIYFPFGNGKIHANMYIMLVGLAGTRKSTAIKLGASLLKAAGYRKFAAKKTRQEKFLIDMAEAAEEDYVAEDILDLNLFGGGSGGLAGTKEAMRIAEGRPPSEVFIAADEINNFIGQGNLEFMSILGDLWDIDEPFDYRLKNSKSVIIPYPTITMLGGNTFEGFNRLFPAEAAEQGFFSRMLFIYAEPKGRIYTIPPEPDKDIEAQLIAKLHEIKANVQGKITISKDAYVILDTIYKSWEGMNDPRFDPYENRRLTHLLKLAMLIMATNLRTQITKDDIIEANTILTFTEQLMPKALGEFGRARNSAVTHKVMAMIDASYSPVSFQTIWKAMHQDLESREALVTLLGNLQLAEKVQSVEGGFLPMKKVTRDGEKGTTNWNLLTLEERKLI